MKENTDLERKLSLKKRSIKDLADYIKTRSGVNPNYCFFLGAGASVTSGITTAVQLVDDWRKEVYQRMSSSPYENEDDAKKWFERNHGDWYETNNEYSSLFEKKFDLPSQRRRFVELEVDKKLPSIGYAYLVELFESNYIDTVFTTNFDDLINEAFYQFSSNRPLLCAHDSSIRSVSITSSRPKIIKLHGDYLFDSIKSSLKETESLEVNTKEKLVEFTKEYGLIFVGYAGNDNSIMEVVKNLLKQEEHLKNGIYWCKRVGDNFSPDLIKLLNHERVYWVEIEGFDQLMAGLVHEMKLELSLGGAQKSTKRDMMISNFITDKFGLGNNPFISDDLKKIKRHVFTQDISSLINDLSDHDNDDYKIPESDFKKLLFIDSLIKNKKYDDAVLKINGFLSEGVDEGIKPKYYRRLMNVYKALGDLNKGIEQSDKLISLDENNVNFAISRVNLLGSDREKIDYLKILSGRFDYNSNLKNELARFSINYIDDSNDTSFVSHDEILYWLSSSLKMDGSLNNRAWKIKYDAIKSKYSTTVDKKQRNEEMDALVHSMSVINPTHDNYLKVATLFITEKRQAQEVRKFINNIGELYKASSINKKKVILNLISGMNLSLLNTNSFEGNFDVISEFIEIYDKEAISSSISSFLLLKARFEIGFNRNVTSGLSFAKQAIEGKWKSQYVDEACSILLIDSKNVKLVKDYLDSLGDDYSDLISGKILSDIKIIEGDFDGALSVLDELEKKSWVKNKVVHSKAYVYLRAGRYDEVINYIDSKINSIRDYKDVDVLIINREVAKKKKGMPVKDNEIRSVISHFRSTGEAAMCAFYLLNDELNAKKQLINIIANDYMNYFKIKDWPALPAHALTQYEGSAIVA